MNKNANIYSKWNEDAIECWKIKSDCSACKLGNIEDCQMKDTVLKLIARLGEPESKEIKAKLPDLIDKEKTIIALQLQGDTKNMIASKLEMSIHALSQTLWKMNKKFRTVATFSHASRNITAEILEYIRRNGLTDAFEIKMEIKKEPIDLLIEKYQKKLLNISAQIGLAVMQAKDYNCHELGFNEITRKIEVIKEIKTELLKL